MVVRKSFFFVRYFILYCSLSKDALVIVFSSKTLLKNILWQDASCPLKYVCLDGAYKLTVEGDPLLIVGTQDLNHKFKPVAFALARSEKQSDYTFLLNNVKFQFQGIFSYD